MLIQWCLKGIAEYTGFSDQEAKDVLSSGILSEALRAYSGSPIVPTLGNAHDKLSDQALHDHVNNFSFVRQDTPYISLAAGVVRPAALGGVTVHPAWQTAVAFATDFGRRAGYVFRCWCVVAPKGVPEVAGVADAVRELNIFRKFGIFHEEGEIAAKLIVPARQIECVHKVGPDLRPRNFKASVHRGMRIDNPDFVAPERLSNLVEAIA